MYKVPMVEDLRFTGPGPEPERQVCVPVLTKVIIILK